MKAARSAARSPPARLHPPACSRCRRRRPRRAGRGSPRPRGRGPATFVPSSFLLLSMWDRDCCAARRRSLRLIQLTELVLLIRALEDALRLPDLLPWEPARLGDHRRHPEVEPLLEHGLEALPDLVAPREQLLRGELGVHL